MTWTIEFERSAAREFRKLDPRVRLRIREYLVQRILASNNPRSHGKALRGHDGNLWRYRIGAHRVVTNLQDDRMVILIVRVAHRSKVYR